MIAEAVAAAQEADYVIAVVGDNVALTGELCSTATLELVGGQVALLEALAATGTPMIVVLLNSKPAVLPPAALNAAALIQAFNPGMRGGRAIAELVLGQIEPSGRLPVSFPRHVGQQPIYYNGIRGQHGDRYADLSQDPQFAFGEGLSYTTVEYSDLVVHTPEVAPGETIRAEVTLTNTGARPARETVQVYVSDLVTSVTWADKELKSFRQVVVQPGESVTVDLELPAASCTIVDCRRPPHRRAGRVRPARRTQLPDRRPPQRQLPHHADARLDGAQPGRPTWLGTTAGRPGSPRVRRRTEVEQLGVLLAGQRPGPRRRGRMRFRTA